MATIIDQHIENWTERFKAGEIHLVCVAVGGLTTCDTAASLAGLDQQTVWPLTEKVNHLGETGTFWPKCPLTVLPLPTWEDRPAPADLDAFLRKCFADVAEANAKYVKLPTLYIDLNGWGFDYDFYKARRIAEEVLGAEPGVETLYFAPKD